MWPNKEHKFQEISTDRTRLRAAYIKEYTRFLTNEEPNFTPKLKEKYDVRKYAVYMDKERLFEKIYHRVNVLMKNPKAYSEVLETCNECLEKGYEKNFNLRNMSVFKIIGVAEAIKLLSKLPEKWNDRSDIKRLIWDAFRSVMIRTRHYAKQQYDWLKYQNDYFPIINSKEKIEENTEMIVNQLKCLNLEDHLKLCNIQRVPSISFNLIGNLLAM